MGSVAIKYGGISLLDLSRVVHDDDLSEEVLGILARIVLGIRSNVSSSNILD